MKCKEMMSNNVSTSIGNLIDIQELATRHKVKDSRMICQEAGKIIQALNTLEVLFSDGNCTNCGGELDSSDKCDDTLCVLRGKVQH